MTKAGNISSFIEKAKNVHKDLYDYSEFVYTRVHDPEIYKPDYINEKVKLPMSELYKKTVESDQLIRDSGYNLVTVWGR